MVTRVFGKETKNVHYIASTWISTRTSSLVVTVSRAVRRKLLDLILMNSDSINDPGFSAVHHEHEFCYLAPGYISNKIYFVFATPRENVSICWRAQSLQPKTVVTEWDVTVMDCNGLSCHLSLPVIKGDSPTKICFDIAMY